MENWYWIIQISIKTEFYHQKKHKLDFLKPLMNWLELGSLAVPLKIYAHQKPVILKYDILTRYIGNIKSISSRFGQIFKLIQLIHEILKNHGNELCVFKLNQTKVLSISTTSL